jgi:serine/threonine-protein kinase
MGTVFKAYDKQLDEIVALKVLSERFSEDEDAQERFRLEVKSARRLSHPNVVRIHDLGEEGGRKYISMEYVDGGDLKKLLLAQKRLSTAQVIEFIIQIASALAAAHQMGIIHRDIKPANILLTSDKVCKLTDFGIATILKDAQDFSSDVIVGTPLYMSPEQNEGKHLEPSSDIYSLGVVMYEMLTGSPPFKIGNIAYHHIFTQPPEMKGIDKPFRDLVMKCLEKKSSARFVNMEEIVTLLESLRK